MTNQEINKNFRVIGLLEKIVTKRTSIILTKDNSRNQAFIKKEISTLHIILDDEKNISVDFRRDIGYELVGKRITYTCIQEDISGTVEGILHNVPVIGNYRVITQMLIPEDKNLPQYIVNDYSLLD